jgi:hypothetical protein
MQIDPITTTAVATTQNVQHNRVETVRREYTDNAGRQEVKETHYYYYVYDDGKEKKTGTITIIH